MVKNIKSIHCGSRVYPGLTLEVSGIPKVDAWGLHASRLAAQAIFYAPSLNICRVELGGQADEREDQLCAQRRRVLWMADATQTFWMWQIRRAARQLEIVRDAGHQVPDVFQAMLIAKWNHVTNKGSHEEFLAVRGDARSRGRSLAGMDTRGRPKSERPTCPIVEQLGWTMVGIASETPRSCTPRIRNYFTTGLGAIEANEFEKMLNLIPARANKLNHANTKL